MKKWTRTSEIRIAHIMQMMRELRFVRGDTYKALALEWDLSERQARKLTAEASKRVLAEVTDPERVRPLLAETLAQAIRKAMLASEFNSVAQLARVYAEILGIKAAAQTLVTVTPGERTPADARRIVEGLFGSGAMPAPTPTPTAEEKH